MDNLEIYGEISMRVIWS